MARFSELENVEEMAARNSDTFFIPSKSERDGRQIGDAVRLHFLLENPLPGQPRAERMWVTVTRERGLLRSYKGKLQNKPVYIDSLNPGDEITFQPCHIARTLIMKSDPRWIDSFEHKTLVSKMCLDKGEVVRFLYREKSDRKEDSGWRMFSGHETEEYNDDPRNIAVVDVGLMLDRDPTLLEPLKEGVGVVFEREEKDKPWHRVTDWSPKE